MREKKTTGFNALQIIEEGMGVFKANLGSTLLFNLLGSVPMAIGLLFVIGDMSYGRADRNTVIDSTLLLTGLWLWNMLCQTIYRTRLVDYCCRRPPTPLSPTRLGQLFVRQAIIQPYGLLLTPLAWIPVLWGINAVFNIFGVDYHDQPKIKEQLQRTIRIVINNLKSIYLLLAVIWAVRFMVVLNLVVLFLAIPALLKMLFGIDTPFSQADSLLTTFHLIFNTTFFSSVIICCWLCVSPLEKALWATVIFYGESAAKGYDIAARLQELASRRSIKTALSALLLISLATVTLQAAPIPTETIKNRQAVSPQQLRRNINQVLQRREYQWKLPVPRVKNQHSHSVWIDYLHYLAKRIEETLRWLTSRMEQRQTIRHKQHHGFLSWLNRWYVSVAIAGGISLLLLLWLARRWWLERRHRIRTNSSPTQQPMPVDLNNEEETTADIMNPNAWRELAESLLADGKIKLATRALFLATIRILSDAQLLTIARGKTNGDYLSELQRRAVHSPETIKLFSSNLLLFERLWYGNHDISKSDFVQFKNRIEHIISTLQK